MLLCFLLPLVAVFFVAPALSAGRGWPAFGATFVLQLIFLAAMLAVGWKDLDFSVAGTAEYVVWFSVLFLALPTAMGGLVLWARAKEEADDSSRCRKCGYDLRESPRRCPECGAERYPNPDRFE